MQSLFHKSRAIVIQAVAQTHERLPIANDRTSGSQAADSREEGCRPSRAPSHVGLGVLSAWHARGAACGMR
jgi:hypothetical protein